MLGNFEPPVMMEPPVNEPQHYGPEAQHMAVLSNDANDKTQPSRGGGMGFFGGFMSGLRRLPRAMDKHHSRQSLHEEYMAEAQSITSARFAHMSPNPSQGSSFPSCQNNTITQKAIVQF